MATKYEFPLISNEDKKLPLYVVTAAQHNQAKIDRPYGIPDYQLLFTTKGHGIVRLEKKQYTLSQSNILILPPNVPQKYRPIDDWETLYITYKLNFLNDSIFIPASVFIPDNPESYLSLGQQIVQKSGEPNFCRKTSPLLYQLILDIQWEQNSGKKENTTLIEVYKYVENHFFENLDLTYLSGMCGLVPEYFSRLYKKTYNISPNEHIHKLRMQAAKEKLIFSNHSISEISKSVGYNSPSHFIKLFKNQENLTPIQFRKLYKKT